MIEDRSPALLMVATCESFLLSSSDKFVIPFSSIFFNDFASYSEIAANALFLLLSNLFKWLVLLSRSSFNFASVICTISNTVLCPAIDSRDFARYASWSILMTGGVIIILTNSLSLLPVLFHSLYHYYFYLDRELFPLILPHTYIVVVSNI